MAAVAPPQTLPTTTTNGSSSSPETEYQRDVRQLVDLLSKLNPSAKEFFPSSYPAPADGVTSDVKNSPSSDGSGSRRLSADAPIFVASTDYYNNNNNIYSPNSNSSGSSDGSAGYQLNRRRRRINGYASQGGRRRMMNEMARRAEREESIRRTVYVSDIDHHVTEEHLADLFANCGQVIDCRICGDPHSVLRFAFIEFADEDGARAALNFGGTMLGFYPVRVLPSKTAILPVNPKFLPRSNDEREMVGRTVYCTNIDKKVTPSDVKIFFQQRCGEVSRLRLLGDNVHSTRIAFVEFALAESAIVALNCSGMFLGTLPVRVSPSKTPVRPRVPRAASH